MFPSHTFGDLRAGEVAGSTRQLLALINRCLNLRVSEAMKLLYMVGLDSSSLRAPSSTNQPEDVEDQGHSAASLLR